jgi:LysR family pca operon transcriptional activator
LTAAGRRFLPYAERCLALLTEAGREVRSEAVRRELRLAAPASLAEWLFAPLASALVEAGFDVSLSTDHSPQVVEMLLDGRLDVGVCSAGPTPAAVAAVRLPTMPIVCVARADDPLAARPPGSYGLADLAVRLAFFEWADEVTDLVERVRVATGASRLRGYVKVSPAEVARRLVVEGQALAFLPRLLVARELEAGSLMIVEPRDAPPYAWQLMLVHRQRDATDADIAEVIATTVKLLSSADGTPRHPGSDGDER